MVRNLSKISEILGDAAPEEQVQLFVSIVSENISLQDLLHTTLTAKSLMQIRHEAFSLLARHIKSDSLKKLASATAQYKIAETFIDLHDLDIRGYCLKSGMPEEVFCSMQQGKLLVKDLLHTHPHAALFPLLQRPTSNTSIH